MTDKFSNKFVGDVQPSLEMFDVHASKPISISAGPPQSQKIYSAIAELAEIMTQERLAAELAETIGNHLKNNEASSNVIGSKSDKLTAQSQLYYKNLDEKHELALRDLIARHGDNAEIRKGFQLVLADPTLEIAHETIKKIVSYLPESPGYFMAASLANYDKAYMVKYPKQDHPAWRYSYQNVRSSEEIARLRINDIALMLCAEIDRIEKQHESINQRLSDIDRSITMVEWLRSFAVQSNLTSVAETEKALHVAASSTKSPQGRYALEILAQFWPAGQSSEAVEKKLKNIDLITNQWRSDLNRQGVTVVNLLDRASKGQSQQLGYTS